MKRFALLVGFALASAPVALGCSKGHDASTTPRAVDHVKLPLAPRLVGIRWTKVDDSTTDLTLGTGPDATKVGGTQHHRTVSEVLAVGADGIVSKLAVSYPERVDDTVGPGTSARSSPLTGHSYVVWTQGHEVAATHADGSAVSADELAALTGDQDELGKPPVMEQLLAGRTWKVNQTYVLNAAELLRLAEAKDGKGAAATEMTLTLLRVVDGDAEFAMTMTMENSAPAMTIAVTGSMTIDAVTGRPKRFEMTGPVTGDAGGGVPITGTMRGRITYEFSGPPAPTHAP